MGNERISVIGGGLMGAGIAQTFAAANYEVCVFEPFDEVRKTLVERIEADLVRIGADASASANITATADLAEAIGQADFVTEAIPERLDLKRNMFADLVAKAPRSCILASNSSVMPIGSIAEGLETTDRIVGTHWWNPAVLIPLVEVIQGEQTSDDTISTTMSILTDIGKKPAHVKKDVPGFVANRLQHALWREAIAMVAEGVCDAQTLDDCVKNSFGLRLPVLGPLENADLVGLDLTLDIHRTIMPELDTSSGPNPFLEEQINAGKLGFKSGEGFRSWSEGEMATLRGDLFEHLVKAQNERAKA